MAVELTQTQLRRAGEISGSIAHLNDAIRFWQNATLSTSTVSVALLTLQENKATATFEGKNENLNGIRDAVTVLYRQQIDRLERELEKMGLSVKR